MSRKFGIPGIFNSFKKRYVREGFNPGLLGIFVNPFYFARRGLYQNILKLSPGLSGVLLDIGCGTKPYEEICNIDEYIGLEIEDGSDRQYRYADVYYDGKKIPFQNNKFDSVISNQVFEHVFNPDQFLRELNRVLKTDGLLLITVPFIWCEHEQPHDYARYSSFGLVHILEKNGFNILKHEKSSSGIMVVFQLLNAYIYKVFLTNIKYINLLVTIT